MKFSSFLAILFFLLGADLSWANEYESELDLREAIFSRNDNHVIEPDALLLLMNKYLNLDEEDFDVAREQYRNRVEILVYLSDPKLCPILGVYSEKFNYKLLELLPYTNVGHYIYHQLQERMKDGCRQGEDKPYFMSVYEKKLEEQESAIKFQQNKQKLWDLLLNEEDMDPNETLEIMADLYVNFEDTSNSTSRYLMRLISLNRIDYKNCNLPNNIGPDSLPMRWLRLPKIKRYIEHFQKVKEDDCEWLQLSEEEKFALPTVDGVDCNPPVRMGLKKFFLVSRSLLLNPNDCNPDMQKVGRYMINLSTCSDSTCCSVKGVFHSNKYNSYIEPMEKLSERICATWINDNLIPLAGKLQSQIKLISPLSQKHAEKSVSQAVEPVLTKQVIPGIKSRTSVKLSKLNDLFIKPCIEIDSAVSSYGNLMKHLMRPSMAVEIQLDELSMSLQRSWRWCQQNLTELDDLVKKVAKNKKNANS